MSRRIVLGAGSKGSEDEIVDGLTKRLESFANECSQPFKVTYHSRIQNYAVYSVTGFFFDDAMSQRLTTDFPGAEYNGDTHSLRLPLGRVGRMGGGGSRGRSTSPSPNRASSPFIGLVVRLVCIYVLVTRVILSPV